VLLLPLLLLFEEAALKFCEKFCAVCCTHARTIVLSFSFSPTRPPGRFQDWLSLRQKINDIRSSSSGGREFFLFSRVFLCPRRSGIATCIVCSICSPVLDNPPSKCFLDTDWLSSRALARVCTFPDLMLSRDALDTLVLEDTPLCLATLFLPSLEVLLCF
jgi:hypothetical protein